MTVSHVTAHVLDTTTGSPAAGVEIVLERAEGDGRTAGGWAFVARSVTDDDGRVRGLGPELLAPGTYRLTFETGAYFAASGVETFFPYITVVFTVDATGRHYHVPLLVSPFALSSYRGS
ncbi:hydroxyisourate hydrolase [Sanguibacter antarcticus]|uniref:5-hydroxyisourate hydrolase n=1 Tax=Sanguibacter antarcticus TaxID=372484 RepID=A0A2A9E318_9MICO|nr:hydroxyisourate hydrolase [Sanguibacter antarcticus]PFG32971.1 5-hydroxyisourate hydrolase [Sanguibacter antarcticus]